MDEEPLGALLKGKGSYQRVEKGMLKFQIMHRHSRSDHSIKWGENDVGKQDYARFRRKAGIRVGNVSQWLHQGLGECGGARIPQAWSRGPHEVLRSQITEYEGGPWS